MCGKCKDCNENENNSTKRTLVVLVLFSVTLSALGISCFALLTVEKLSKDLNYLRLLLSRTRVEPSKQPAYSFIDDVKRAELAPGVIYETPPDGKTEKILRFKRNSDSERVNTNTNYDNIFEETTFGTHSEISTENSPVHFEPTIRPPASDGNMAFPINSVDEIVNTDIENSSATRVNSESTSKTFFQTNETSIPLIESASNIGDIHKKTELNNKSSQVSNPLKKDVETFTPEVHENYHEITERHFLSLPHKTNIPSVIEDTQDQTDHNIKKKAVNYDDVESFTPEYKLPRNVYRHKQRGRNGNQLEIIDEFSPQAGRLKSLIAIHLNGDTSQYTLGVHTNYKGNGHLRHSQKTFIDWKMSDWIETISASNSFHLKNGVVTVEESGLYFIYAQIYYLDEHDSNGYMVRRNSENILHCKVTAPSSERLMKGNTCYTGAVVYLDTNDRISLDDISDGRYTLFIPGYSFFGMIKIGDIKGK